MDRKQSELVVPPLVRTSHTSCRVSIPRMRVLALHPLVDLPIRVAKKTLLSTIDETPLQARQANSHLLALGQVLSCQTVRETLDLLF